MKYDIDDLYRNKKLKFKPYPECPHCNDHIKITKTQYDDIHIYCPACGGIDIFGTNMANAIQVWNHQCEDYLITKRSYIYMILVLSFPIIWIISNWIVIPILLVGLFIAYDIYKIKKNFQKKIDDYLLIANQPQEYNASIDELISKLTKYKKEQVVQSIIDILIKIKSYHNDDIEKRVLQDSVPIYRLLNGKISIKNQMIHNILNEYLVICKDYLQQVLDYKNIVSDVTLKVIAEEMKNKADYIKIKNIK